MTWKRAHQPPRAYSCRNVTTWNLSLYWTTIRLKYQLLKNTRYEGAYWRLSFIFYIDLPFIVQWYRNVKDAERPPDGALRPGEGLSILRSAITRPSSGRQTRILREVCWKHDHQGNLNTFLGSGRTCRHLHVRSVILQRRESKSRGEASDTTTTSRSRQHQPLQREQRGQREAAR